MKICLAQTQSKKGDIESNISNHILWIEKAVNLQADLVVFSELSLTGFEPELAGSLAVDLEDPRLDEFQQISDLKGIAIGVGAPTKFNSEILISMIIFQPNRSRTVYSKQMLHDDELPYFSTGNEQIILDIQNTKIAPAICYESLQPKHASDAKQLGADVYLASVAKPQNGIEKANICYPITAQKHIIPVLMVNCIGSCDNFMSVGQTSIWDKKGTIISQLDNENEGLLLFDTETNQVEKVR